MDLFVSLFALVLLCSALVCKLKLNASAAPLVCLCGIQLLLILTGICRLLVPGMVLIYALALFCGWLVWVRDRRQWKQNLAALLQPGFVFFLAATVFFCLLMHSKNAGFRSWDEFSFWGSAAKAIFENNKLYTLFDHSMANTSYPPALALTSYFLQFLGGRFSEWKCYAAYNMLAMACVTPLFGRVKWKNPLRLLLATGLGYFGIYEFFHTFTGLRPYANTYSDWMVGLVFGGVLAVWYTAGSGKTRYFAAMLCAAMLPLTRDIGLALGLVATGIMTIDMLLSGEAPFKKKDGKGSFLLGCGCGLGLMAAVGVSYIMWSAHFSAVNDIPRVSIPYEYSALQIFTGQDPYFNTILQKMWNALFTEQLVNFGTVAEMIAVFTAVALGFAAIAKGWRNKLRFVSFAALNIFGFALYYVFHAYLYTAVFYHTENYDLVCYARYIGSYAIGWYFALISMAASETGEPMWAEKLPQKLQGVYSNLPAALLTAAALFSVFHYLPVPAEHTFIHSENVPVFSDGVKELAEKTYRSYYSVFKSKPRVYIVAQDSNGGEWFICNYVFMPAYTVDTLGGGDFVSQEMWDNQDFYANGEFNYSAVVDREIFQSYLRENDVDLIYILGMDQYFIDEFAPMFNDRLEERLDGSVYLYAVQDLGDDMLCHGLYSSEHYFDLKQEWEVQN
ncbi:MAG: hypothetical protein IJP01_01695 [Oscillospiraceae bacterium]|nr:hypothetical protein [Oscillospiraceae bacterium]